MITIVQPAPAGGFEAFDKIIDHEPTAKGIDKAGPCARFTLTRPQGPTHGPPHRDHSPEQAAEILQNHSTSQYPGLHRSLANHIAHDEHHGSTSPHTNTHHVHHNPTTNYIAHDGDCMEAAMVSAAANRAHHREIARMDKMISEEHQRLVAEYDSYSHDEHHHGGRHHHDNNTMTDTTEGRRRHSPALQTNHTVHHAHHNPSPDRRQALASRHQHTEHATGRSPGRHHSPTGHRHSDHPHDHQDKRYADLSPASSLPCYLLSLSLSLLRSLPPSLLSLPPSPSLLVTPVLWLVASCSRRITPQVYRRRDA